MASQLLADLKTCPQCGTAKPASTEFFSYCKPRKALVSWCKPCCAAARRQDRKSRPEHYAAIEKRTYEKHRKIKLERQRQWRASRSETQKQKTREQWNAKRETYKANARRKRQQDPAHAAALRKKALERYYANREAILTANKARWASAPRQKRLRTYIGAAISHSLQGRTKGGKGWQEILGYSADELRRHLERQFLPGMNWENYGQWHIDHILPVASFSFTSPDDDDFKACWAITNLRPLWAKDNIRKSDKRELLL